MNLTLAQLQAIKADIAANPDLAAFAPDVGGNFAVASLYNALAAPSFTVWKTSVSLMAIGNNFVASEVAGLTSVNLQRLQTLAQYRPNGVDPSIADDGQVYYFALKFNGAAGTSDFSNIASTGVASRAPGAAGKPVLRLGGIE